MSTPPRIPSIEQLRQRREGVALEQTFGRDALVAALRAEADHWREMLFATSEPGADAAPTRAATGADPAGDLGAAILAGASSRLAAAFRTRLRPVINATGVIVHTNLGRAPLSAAALARVSEVGAGYCSLEFDLEAGTRGSRSVHAEPLLCQLTGAEAAVVVNNAAAATLLMLATLARGREVVVSRGELVEIGGGFRVPEILAQSGAILREVGTTNRTRLADYGAAIHAHTALILRVHPSNFRIEGFSERPSLDELVRLGRQTGIPVVEDLGSGFLAAGHPRLAESGADRALADEPTVQASVAAGIDLVAFSGDKLLGGPQAGVLVGRRMLVDQVRRHPLMRALRCDKLTYAALEATLVEYVAGRATDTVPVLRMLTLDRNAIQVRATRVAAAWASNTALTVTLVDGHSTVGGGSAPTSAIPSVLVALSHARWSADELARRLRGCDPPVIGRIMDRTVTLDLRTVAEVDDERLVSLVNELA